ncbi:MAG: GTPase domain-containing protein [Candidatus Hinthialibacter antarcticus]|nr:GTPase domain-containing protein [Candidatus Hinthialibacter antarcticus]
MKIDSLRAQLAAINTRLSEMTGREEVNLSYQTGESSADMLFLYGVLGGKDVGKTSMINLLAGARISIDSDLIDEGTKTCVAYCHQNDLEHLRKRVNADLSGSIEFASHQRDELRNVVLIDFPDFDSRFDDHLEEVRRLGPFLQGIVWITSPRKYADHEFLDRLETVAQSHENLYMVLNKVDQLDGKAGLDAIREEVLSVIQYGCERAGLPPIGKGRIWLTSALYPDRFEFNDLYQRLVRVHSAEEIARAKAQNLKSEFEKNIQRIQRQFAIDDRIETIDQALEYIQIQTSEHFSEAYFNAVRQRVLSLEPVNRRISAGVFYQRIDHWPILRTLFYPLSGLVSFIGGRFTFTPKSSDWAESPLDLLRHDGESAAVKLQSIQSGLQTRYPKTLDAQPLPTDLSHFLERRFNALLRLYEDRVVERLSSDFQAPGALMKTLIFLPLVWFPFMQPVLLHLFQDETAWLSFSGVFEFGALLISLFGAGALLESLIFLILFYFLWLMALYARGTRKILMTGDETLRDVWYEDWLPSLIEFFESPLQKRRAQWVDISAQIEEIERDIDGEANRLS